MTTNTFKLTQGMLLLITLVICGSSFYFEYWLGMQPCPLCLMQRLCAILFGVGCLVGLLCKQTACMRLVLLSQMLIASAGFYFASRQWWLQQLPMSDAQVCLPGMMMLLQYFSWHDVLHALFWGAGDCAENKWQLLGVSMPLWVAIYFVVMLVGSVLLFWQHSNCNHTEKGNKDVKKNHGEPIES